jgi:transcriptional regulator with XRE-family HTH domain
MSQLSDNLTSRRKQLGLEVADVHEALSRAGFDLAYSTVAGWLNGNRGVRKMEHLKALCAVLQTDLNTLAGDEVEVAEGKVESSVVREMRDLDPVQREAVLALVRSMKRRP